MRSISYAEAINEALWQILETDSNAVLIGQGVISPWYVGSTTQGLVQQFGRKRVIDTPVSENAIAGMAIGMALTGMHPILVHPRMDFMWDSMDQIANNVCTRNYLFGKPQRLPMVFWSCINRGNEQAGQHSQDLHAIFAHLPLLNVVAPSRPYDAKGLLIEALQCGTPTIYIDDRWLYNIEECGVPENMYYVPIGKGETRQNGHDVTVVSSSYMVLECVKAAEVLLKEGISVEVLDLRSLKPVDKSLLFNSVKKTGKLVVVDGGWRTCGYAAEISALVVENCFSYLEAPIHRVTLPDTPAPSSTMLEKQYYHNAGNIIQSVKIVMEEAQHLQSSLRKLPAPLQVDS